MTASHFLLLITFLSVICHHVAAAPAYLGCYTDKFAAGERDLGSSLFLEEKMTPELCETKCGGVGYKYAGVQFGSECWCGNTYGKYGKVDDSSCSTKCGGDLSRTCGGELLNAVYEVKGTFPPLKNNVEGRPLLALVMIVKDEAHTLPQTLFSLKDYLDYYYILDTGSTDGTPDAIRRTLGDKGEIHNEPFVDYGTSRNRVLDIARDSKNPPIFVLMLSADETVYNAGALRQFCEEHRNSDGAQHEAYPLVMDVGWKFDSVRLSRVDKGWRYVGRVHEYLAAPDQKWHPSLRVPDTYIKFRVTDPERRSNREYTILKILLDEKEKKPQDTRTSFYLARTYNVIGNHSEALAEFERRVSLGGWQEEVYESLYAIAWQKEALGRSWAEIQQAFLDAHDHSPERAEPLYSIASHYYKENKQSLAYMYALYASQLKYPKNAVLWVQAAVYEWQCHFIVGMTAYRLGKYDIGARSIMIATRYNPKDSVILQQMARYKEKIDAETWKKYERQYLLGMNDENASDDNPFSVVVPAKDAQPASPGHETQIKSVPHAADASSPATFKRSDSASIVFPMLLVIVAFILVMTALKQRKRVRSGDSFSDKVV